MNERTKSSETKSSKGDLNTSTWHLNENESEKAKQSKSFTNLASDNSSSTPRFPTLLPTNAVHVRPADLKLAKRGASLESDNSTPTSVESYQIILPTQTALDANQLGVAVAKDSSLSSSSSPLPSILQMPMPLPADTSSHRIIDDEYQLAESDTLEQSALQLNGKERQLQLQSFHQTPVRGKENCTTVTVSSPNGLKPKQVAVPISIPILKNNSDCSSRSSTVNPNKNYNKNKPPTNRRTMAKKTHS